MRGMRTLFIGAQMLYIGLSLQWGVDIFNKQMWVAAFFFFSQEEEERDINTLPCFLHPALEKNKTSESHLASAVPIDGVRATLRQIWYFY